MANYKGMQRAKDVPSILMDNNCRNSSQDNERTDKKTIIDDTKLQVSDPLWPKRYLFFYNRNEI